MRVADSRTSTATGQIRTNPRTLFAFTRIAVLCNLTSRLESFTSQLTGTRFDLDAFAFILNRSFRTKASFVTRIARRFNGTATIRFERRPTWFVDATSFARYRYGAYQELDEFINRCNSSTYDKFPCLSNRDPASHRGIGNLSPELIFHHRHISTDLLYHCNSSSQMCTSSTTTLCRIPIAILVLLAIFVE